MNSKQFDAFSRLYEILEELNSLSDECKDLVKEHFPGSVRWCDAYGVFDFGTSGNPYDSTFERLLQDLEEEELEEEREAMNREIEEDEA